MRSLSSSATRSSSCNCTVLLRRRKLNPTWVADRIPFACPRTQKGRWLIRNFNSTRASCERHWGFGNAIRQPPALSSMIMAGREASPAANCTHAAPLHGMRAKRRCSPAQRGKSPVMKSSISCSIKHASRPRTLSLRSGKWKPTAVSDRIAVTRPHTRKGKSLTLKVSSTIAFCESRCGF